MLRYLFCLFFTINLDKFTWVHIYDFKTCSMLMYSKTYKVRKFILYRLYCERILHENKTILLNIFFLFIFTIFMGNS